MQKILKSQAITSLATNIDDEDLLHIIHKEKGDSSNYSLLQHSTETRTKNEDTLYLKDWILQRSKQGGPVEFPRNGSYWVRTRPPSFPVNTGVKIGVWTPHRGLGQSLCVHTSDPRSLPSDGTPIGVTDTHGVLGCNMTTDYPKMTHENTDSGHIMCANTVGHEVNGMVMARGDQYSTMYTMSSDKVRTHNGHTDIRQPLQPLLTRAGTPAKPPDESITTKLVVVKPTVVSHFISHSSSFVPTRCGGFQTPSGGIISSSDWQPRWIEKGCPGWTPHRSHPADCDQWRTGHPTDLLGSRQAPPSRSSWPRHLN